MARTGPSCDRMPLRLEERLLQTGDQAQIPLLVTTLRLVLQAVVRVRIWNAVRFPIPMRGNETVDEGAIAGSDGSSRSP